MTLPEIYFTGRNLGYDEDGMGGWEDLKETYFRPQCGGTDCVTLVRRPVEGDGSAPCVFLQAVPPRDPYYAGDIIPIEIQAPCSPPTDTSAGTTADGGDNAGQDAGQENGGQDAGQDSEGQDAGQDAGQGNGGQDTGGQDAGQGGSSPASPS
ncbi:hypothetical protein [Streptomyces sp. B8F3]|uniref:hypothetical protein n=1 Tax=unclassified Streptomyces TaxID=2593676 RepID=UPI00325F2A1F